MNFYKILETLHCMTIQQAEKFLPGLKNSTIEELYDEAIYFKKELPVAYDRLSNELNRRKSEQLEKELTLPQDEVNDVTGNGN